MLLTLDTYFADIRMYSPESYYGLIVFRLKYQDTPSVLEILEKILSLFSKEELAGKLWIVDKHKIRTRR